MAQTILRTSPKAKIEWRRRRAALTRSILAPPPKLTVSEWADRYRFLSREASAEPGKWRTDRAPYLRGMMDAFSEPLVEKVCCMTSSQIGKTECINNIAGFFIDQDPAPILVMQPTLELGRAWSKDRLAPMIRDTPRLAGKIKAPRARDSGNTLLHKNFPGGQLTITGANSASSLSARPIRVVLIDELDRAPVSAGTEGDPAMLAEKRTSTFWNKRIGYWSTPTIKDASRIEQAMKESDQRRYHIPCPHCNHMQHLKWQHVTWDKTTADDGTVTHHPETAAYTCEECGAIIEESEKLKMLSAGVWIAEAPGMRVAGFYLNALYSPWARWADLVREFLDAKDIPERLQVFVNTVLGETWEERGERLDAAALASRCDTYQAGSVPAGAGVLTAAVDVQGDRLELVVKGWGAAQESWLICHQVHLGDPGQAEVWERVDLELRKPFPHESGGSLPIRAVVVDTGGHHAESVYSYVRPRQRRHVLAIKGANTAGKAIWPLKPSKTNKHGVKLFTIGTDTAKDAIFSRLRRTQPGPTYMHFPEGTSTEYFAQLTGEKKIRHLVHGRAVFRYVKTRPRNEALDLEVYALAALHSLGPGVYNNLEYWVKKVQAEGARAPKRDPDDPGGAAGVPNPAPPPKPAARPPRRSNWVNRWR